MEPLDDGWIEDMVSVARIEIKAQEDRSEGLNLL